MEQPKQEIQSIWGFEPNNPDCYAAYYSCGVEGVTHIGLYQQSLGEYGIDWLQVYKGNRMIVRMNAKAVAEIHYKEDK